MLDSLVQSYVTMHLQLDTFTKYFSSVTEEMCCRAYIPRKCLVL